MDEPILKLHWERFTAHVDLDVEMAARLLAPYTTDKISELSLLSEGCANTNYKIMFANQRPPVVLRIYVREKSALQREVAVHQLVAGKIPVAKHFYADHRCQIYPYPYAIMAWIDGTLMREIIISKDEQAIESCVFEAGEYLNILRQIKFHQGGFFDGELHIRPFNQEEKYLPFVLGLLKDEIVKDSLGASLLKAVSDLVKKNERLLPNENDANLTHGDYDPANMLVKKTNGRWKIAAILDWEFAFAGTYLLDIGLMLRYGHRLPNSYEEKFIAGIHTGGFQLPKEWKKQAKLMDLLCLLQLTHYNPASERPAMNRDVVSLIADTVNHWEKF